MKNIVLLIILMVSATFSFSQEPNSNLKEEYDKIERSRMFYIKTIKEKQYQNLAACIPLNYKTVNPGTVSWQAMAEIAKERGGIPYDSVSVYPMETVIVSDSVAYGSGRRKTYYTDDQGKPKELEDTFLAILKKRKDGNWRLHREVAS